VDTKAGARQNSPPLLQCRGGGFGSRERRTPRRGKGQHSPASAREGETPRRLLLLFCSAGGEASAREGRAPSQCMTEFSPSFAVWGGRLQRPKPRRLLGARDRILPLFFSARGEASAHEKKAPSQRASPPLLQCEGGGFDSREGAFSACVWAPRNNNQNGETQSKWTFLALQYLWLGAKKLGRLLSARAITRRHQGKVKACARTRTQQSTMVFFVVTFLFYIFRYGINSRQQH